MFLYFYLSSVSETSTFFGLGLKYLKTVLEITIMYKKAVGPKRKCLSVSMWSQISGSSKWNKKQKNAVKMASSNIIDIQSL